MTAIRRATLADAEGAAAAFTASFASMAFVPKLHGAEKDRGFVRGLIADKETWVAERDGRVIGLACWHDGWLEQLYVDPAHHGLRTRVAPRGERHDPVDAGIGECVVARCQRGLRRIPVAPGRTGQSCRGTRRAAAPRPGSALRLPARSPSR